MPDTTDAPVADTSGVAAALAAAEKHAQVLDANGDGTLLVVAHRNDRQIKQIDLERYEDRPARQRGTVTALSADGFVKAFLRIDPAEGAHIYADPDACRLIAVLNDDHQENAGWRDHLIELDLQETPEWRHWTGNVGLVTQAQFAEVIEDGQHEIVGTPSATEMLEVAQLFTASLGGKFRQEGRLRDGTTQFRYEETVDAKVGEGLIPVPQYFTVRVRPFYGAEPRELEARIRYRCAGGHLQIGYILHRPDEVRRESFSSDVLGYLNEELPSHTIVEGIPADPAIALGR